MPQVPPDHQIPKGCIHLNNFLVDTCKSHCQKNKRHCCTVKPGTHKKHVIKFIWLSIIHGLIVILANIDALNNTLYRKTYNCCSLVQFPSSGGSEPYKLFPCSDLCPKEKKIFRYTTKWYKGNTNMRKSRNASFRNKLTKFATDLTFQFLVVLAQLICDMQESWMK